MEDTDWSRVLPWSPMAEVNNSFAQRVWLNGWSGSGTVLGPQARKKCLSKRGAADEIKEH
jgi:hypothetical protein